MRVQPDAPKSAALCGPSRFHEIPASDHDAGYDGVPALESRSVHADVYDRVRVFSVALSNRFRSGIVELPCEPFRFRRIRNGESNVDAIKIICGCFAHSRCNQRVGNRAGFRRTPDLRSNDIAKGVWGSYAVCGITFAQDPVDRELHEQPRSPLQSIDAGCRRRRWWRWRRRRRPVSQPYRVCRWNRTPPG